MRRAVVAYWALALAVLGLAGCGLSRFEQREAWRAQAEEACLAQKLVRPTAYMSQMSPIDGPGACGMTKPFGITAFGDGTVGLSRRATLACPVIPRIEQWLAEVVQPAAELYYGQGVVELKSGSYSCRGRNNQRGAKLSEHAFGNAVDVMGFVLSDGRTVTVVKGWRGEPADQEFLREVFVGACTIFSTVLGPGSDRFHYDHFHLDLARHDPRGTRRICRPMLKFEPRIGEGGLVAKGYERPVEAEAPMTPRAPVAEAPRRPLARASRLDLPPEEPDLVRDDEEGEEEPAPLPPSRQSIAPSVATPVLAPAAPAARAYPADLPPPPRGIPAAGGGGAHRGGVPHPPQRGFSGSGIY